MKVYISGPITDTDDYIERFDKAQKYLESLGCSVINPALVNSNLPDDTTYDQYMKMSIAMLEMCDAIYLLHGYEKSRGANLELWKARKLGIQVLREDTPADMYPVTLTPDKINAIYGLGL